MRTLFAILQIPINWLIHRIDGISWRFARCSLYCLRF